MASRGVNLEDGQGTARLMTQYGVSTAGSGELWSRWLDKRIENANSLETQERCLLCV